MSVQLGRLCLVLLLLSCTERPTLKKVTSDEVPIIAMKYIGELARQNPKFGIDSTMAVFIGYEWMKDNCNYEVVFHDSGKGKIIYVEVDTFGNPEFYGSVLRDSNNYPFLQVK